MPPEQGSDAGIQLLGERSLYSEVLQAHTLLLSIALSLQAWCALPQGAPAASSPDVLEHSARTALERGDFAAAVRDFRLALISSPRSASLHAGLGTALAGQGMLNEAIDEQTRALRLKPADPAMHRALASLLYRAGNYARARSELQPLVAANPQDLASAMLLGYVDIKLDRSAESLSILAPLETAHRDNLDLIYALAFAMIQTGNIADGAPRMERVAGIRKSADAWMVAGIARFDHKQFRTAQADAEEALHLDSKIRGGSTLLGKSLYVLGQHEAAVPPLRAALRADPADFEANLYLATVRLEQKDYRTAESLLDLALQLRPGYPLARLDRAKIFALTGRTKDALPILEGLIDGKPDWKEAHWELANDYFKLDRAAEGRRERAIVEQLQGDPPR